MASMPHITVKVESSQVQRLIEMADQLRKMSDDLREVISTASVTTDRGISPVKKAYELGLFGSNPDLAKVAEEYFAAKKMLAESHFGDAATMSATPLADLTAKFGHPSEVDKWEPSTMSAAAAMHETVGTQPNDDSPDDPYGIDKSAREHSGLHRLPPGEIDRQLRAAVSEGNLVRDPNPPVEVHTDDPDAIQDGP